MRMGVIGAGRWGRNVLRTFREMSGVEVSCVASRNPATRDLVGPTCRIEQDWRMLLRRGYVDAVVIATPPATHAGIAIEAVAAGLPVFVEKPLTCDLGEAERLFDLAARQDGYILVDHTHLFSHAYRTLKARLPALGPVQRIETEAGGWGPFRPDTPVLWDWGPHDAAFCLDLLGALPVSVTAERIQEPGPDRAYGETLSLSAAYPHGVAARIRLSNLLREKRRHLLVEGSGGSLVYDDRTDPKVMHRPSGPADAAPETIPVPGGAPLACALEHFCEHVAAERRSLDDLRFGVDVVRMLDAWEAVWR